MLVDDMIRELRAEGLAMHECRVWYPKRSGKSAEALLTAEALRRPMRQILCDLRQADDFEWINRGQTHFTFMLHYVAADTSRVQNQDKPGASRCRLHYPRTPVRTLLDRLRHSDPLVDEFYCDNKAQVTSLVRERINTCPCKWHTERRASGIEGTSLPDDAIWYGLETWMTCESQTERREYIEMTLFSQHPGLKTRRGWKERRAAIFRFADEDHCFHSFCDLVGYGFYPVRNMMQKLLGGKKKRRSQGRVADQTDMDAVAEWQLVDEELLDPGDERAPDPEDGPIDAATALFGRQMSRTDLTREFLHSFVEYYIEHSPEGDKARIPMMVKKQIYELDYMVWMTQFCDSANDRHKPVSYKWFVQLWRMEFTGKIRMTDKRRFSQCSTCQGLCFWRLCAFTVLNHIPTDSLLPVSD